MLFPVPGTVIVAFETPVVADVEESEPIATNETDEGRAQNRSEPIATSFTALTDVLFPIAIELSLLAFEF